ncbi:Preprotein translocase subunit SECE1 [Quillaja saponaria]|uniref:Preprotein translocase subunit SECE1 n=1 Tax=Quillaja saponaria TaxID=32244 RepID=A0AAD7KZG7_QUISA|nr:Preprotein translocase subunit SECE1 [Quillaja saponaria]
MSNAVEESQENSELEAAGTQERLSGSEEQQSLSQTTNSSVELSELGSEIKNAMQERKEKEERDGGDLLSGVAEEIREIEWPAFGKVLGTTGVVLGIIAGSSVVLLTVNVILAELSDRVFAGSVKIALCCITSVLDLPSVSNSPSPYSCAFNLLKGENEILPNKC